MTKNVWVQPRTAVQQFVANEYVASSCGDSGVTYLFECNAPRGTLYYYPRSDGKIDGVYNGTGRSDKLGGYKPCQDKHSAPDTGDFYDGFVDYNGNRRQDEGEGVIVWLERGWFGDIWDYHATNKLNMDEWETDRS